MLLDLKGVAFPVSLLQKMNTHQSTVISSGSSVVQLCGSNDDDIGRPNSLWSRSELLCTCDARAIQKDRALSSRKILQLITPNFEQIMKSILFLVLCLGLRNITGQPTKATTEVPKDAIIIPATIFVLFAYPNRQNIMMFWLSCKNSLSLFWKGLKK